MISECLGETVSPMESLGCKLAIGMSRPSDISDRAEEMHSARACSLSPRIQLFSISTKTQNLHHNKTARPRRKINLETDRQEHKPIAAMIYAHYARLLFSAL